MKNFTLSVSLVLILFAAQFVLAQGSSVKIMAEFNKPVNVGRGQVLEPGRYTFHLVHDQTDRNVFRVQSEDGKNITLTGTNFDSRQTAIANGDTAASPTYIVLENVGGQLYLHRMSLGFQNRGFEFQLPDNIKNQVNQSTQVIVPASGGNAD